MIAKQALALAVALAGAAQGIEIFSRNVVGTWDDGGCWIGGVPPDPGDIAVFQTLGNTSRNNALGSDQSWLGIRFSETIGRAMTLNAAGSETLSLGAAGIDMSQAITSGNVAQSIQVKIHLGAAQAWNIHEGLASNQSLAVAGALSGPAGSTLSKTGGGRLALSGSNSHAGATQVEAGTLLVDGDSSAATGTVTVAAGAVLGGVGTLGGDVLFEAGAKFLFNQNAPLSIAAGGQAAFGGFGAADVAGIGRNTAPGAYLLVAGSIDLSNVSDIGEANAQDFGWHRAWFEAIGGGLAIHIDSAPLTLPEVFPINMGFKTLLSGPDHPNHAFDTLENAGRYAVHHGNVANMDLIKTNYPDVMTLAMNPRSVDGENRSNSIGSPATGNVWPGFWLYHAGSRLAAAIGAADTQIPVEDASRFSTRNYALVCQLDGEGRPAFLASAAYGANGTYEIVNIIGVDTDNNTLAVVRGQTGTTAKPFASGQSAALPFREAWAIDNKITQIRANFSLVAPRHPVTGENAAESWGRGRGAAIRDGLNDGTEADIVHCLAGDRTDADLDLEPDGGFRDGINTWSLGWQEHVEIVRGIIGPNRILQHDCTRAPSGYRGWRHVNGVQLETFGGGEDFSQAFDLLEQWVGHAEVQPAFSYGYCRAPTTTYGGVQPDNDWMFRKQFAAGLMLGMPHPYGSGENMGLFDWDEQRGGELDDYAWLGRALGPYQRDFGGLGAADLLAGGSWTVETAAGFASTHSGSPSDPEGIGIDVVQIPPLLQGDPAYGGVILKWNSPAIPLQRGAEYTLVFEARASDAITYNGKTYEGLPGFVRIRDYKGTIARFNLLVPGGWRTYRLTYTVPDEGGSANFKASFQLAEEAQRTFRLRNIRLYTGTADRLKREFENGTVFLNESHVQPWTVDLGADLLWRLKGSIRPDIHDGAMVAGSFSVPARDAAYLLKPTYANWAKGAGLGGAPGFGAEMLDDPDGDGVPNLLEWVLSGDPLEPHTARLPDVRMEGGLPVYGFSRSLLSKQGAACIVQYKTDLADGEEAWREVPVDGAPPPGVSVSIEDQGDGTERIEVAFGPEQAAGGRFFMRLAVAANQP